MVLEKTLESPVDCKEIKPVNVPKEIKPEYSLEGLMLKLNLSQVAVQKTQFRLADTLSELCRALETIQL